MADPSDPSDLATFNPFIFDGAPAFVPTPAQQQARHPANDPADLATFDPFQYGEDAKQSGSSATGAFARGTVGGAAPGIIGGIGGFGAGFAVGEALFPPGGGLVGGLATAGAGFVGSYFGAQGVSTAQNWALDKLPKIRDMLGQSEEQKRLDEKDHPLASWMGGVAPYLLTMSPMAALPGGTTWQRLAANPLTGRLISGGIVGGAQLGQEAVSEDKVNWNHVAIATVMGLVFNKPNRIGEAISEFGAKPARFVFGKASPAERPPTTAEINESTAGPGMTEATFMGQESRNPAAEMAAIHDAGVEQSLIGPIRPPDLELTARKMQPELFSEYDDLRNRRAAFKSWIDEFNEPSPSSLEALQDQREGLEKELADHIASRNGYEAGPTARRLRAQIRQVQGEHDLLTERASAFKAGTAEETADLAAARRHMMAADEALRDIQPRLRAAYQAAADYTGAPTVAPPEVAAPPEAIATEAPAGATEPGTTAEAATPPAAPPSGPLDEQKLQIAKHFADQAVASGAPPEEAALLGRLVATYYASRASRFGGAIGDALSLYEKEGEKLVIGRYTVTPPVKAKGEPPMALPTTRQELAAFLAAGGKVEGARSGTIQTAPRVEAEPPAVAVTKRTPSGLRSQPQERDSLLQFIVRAGGIAMDDANISDVRALIGSQNHLVGGFGPLIQKNGRTLDRMAMAAKEAGFFHDQADIGGGVSDFGKRELLDAMDAELRGNKQYRLGVAPPEQPVDVDEEQHFKEGALEQAGPEPDQLAHLSQQDIDDFFQAARGSVRFTDGLRAVITRLPDANASTVIHELGHSWLEQLMRDSLHEAAPDSVRNDAATVMKWLGIDSPEALAERTQKGNLKASAVRAHEKFATGFEQYMREGRAPTAELASVFARFREWLLEIYTTIKGLGKEISPDIRAVFDRMLTEEPGRTVVTPDHPGGPSITEIHEIDAKTVEPAEAEPAADRVAAERDRYAEDQPPEIKAGLEAKARAAGIETAEPAAGAEPAGQGIAVAGGPGEVVGGGGATEPVAPGGGVREEHGAVEPSGANAGAEGAAVPGAGQRTGEPAAGPASATDRDHALAPRPAADSLPPREAQAVDAAGNIRVENLTTVEEVAQALHDSADRNHDFDGVRGAPMSKGQMWDLASDMGMDAGSVDDGVLETQLEKLLGGMKDMAPKVLAARRLIKQSATIVSDLMRRAAQSDSDADAYELARAIARHDMIQSSLSAATASWGRTGSAFHDISADWDTAAINKILKDKTGRTLYQIKQIAKLGAEYDSTRQISKLVRDSGLHPWRMILEAWINGLISALPTHLTYAIGSDILATLKLGPETMAAAGIGSLRRALGREGDTVRLGEVAAGLRGVAAGFWPSMQASLDAIRTGTTVLLPGETAATAKFLQPAAAEAIKAAVMNEAATFQDVMGSAFGIMRGIKDGVVAGAALQRAGGDPKAPMFAWIKTPGGEIPSLAIRGTYLPLGETMRAPSRMIAAIHSFWRPMLYSIEKYQMAYRAAANENLIGPHFDAKVAELAANPTPEIMEAAAKASTDYTLMGAGGAFTQKLSRLINHEFLGRRDADGKMVPGTGVPLLKFIDPFVHISTNIINKSIVERTPVGLLSSSIRADLMGRNGNVAADTAAGRMLVGTALSLLFGGLAAEGYVTGSGPSDPRNAAIWRQVYQPHSIRIGDTWYDMHRLGPLGMLLSTAADLYDVSHMAGRGEVAGAAMALVHGVAQNVLDESFMRGPSDLLKAIENPERYGSAYIANFVSSFVPFSVAMSYMARASDPYSRQARGIVDAIRAKVPGLSESLMPRRDIWGEMIPSRDNLGPSGVTAIWTQKVNSDPVNQALLNLGMHVAPVRRSIRNVQLNEQQYDDWQRLAGRLAKLRMDAIVRSPSFQTMPPGYQRDLLNEQLRQSREVARNMMFMKYPSILVDAQAVKMAKRTGQTP